MPDNNGNYPVDLATVKQYLRVDFPDDDALIGIMIDTAKGYIRDGIGAFEPENPKHNMILLAVVSHLYENRQFQAQSSGKIMHIIRSMMWQERLNYEETED